MLAAAELNMLSADHHAQQAGVAAAIQHAALRVVSACPDDQVVMEYLSWRSQRDAVTVTHATPPARADDALILTTAVAAATPPRTC